jgi:hypothetical protein
MHSPVFYWLNRHFGPRTLRVISSFLNFRGRFSLSILFLSKSPLCWWKVSREGRKGKMYFSYQSHASINCHIMLCVICVAFILAMQHKQGLIICSSKPPRISNQIQAGELGTTCCVFLHLLQYIACVDCGVNWDYWATTSWRVKSALEHENGGEKAAGLQTQVKCDIWSIYNNED